MVIIEGFDYQISCRLRKTEEEVILKGCPFFHSEGHGDQSCLLLLAKEMERVQKSESEDEIFWKTENITKTVFGEIPPEKQDYKALAEWKFPGCPMIEYEK